MNYASSAISKWSFKLIDDARAIIYDRNMFIIQATRINGQDESIRQAWKNLAGGKRSSLFYPYVGVESKKVLH